MTSFSNTILSSPSSTALDSCPTLGLYTATDIVPTAPSIYTKLLTTNGILFALVVSCLLLADIVVHLFIKSKLQTTAMTDRSEPVSEAHGPKKIENGQATIEDLVDSVPDSRTAVTTNRIESISETQEKVKATKVDSVDTVDTLAEPTDYESLGAEATTTTDLVTAIHNTT
ncbi:hypothetical protein BGX38DRAFT_1196140 [Terfezia claveryi]|nr:hypothetical protein BGX38DRAFT_1196140 [Terfezia claveryi]